MIGTIRRLLGTPVSVRDSEEILGRVSDVVVDTETKKVPALLMATNSIIPFTRMILCKDIRHVGRDGIILGDASEVRLFLPEELPPNAAAYFERFHGRKVDDGARPGGRIRDPLFDTEAGELTDFILADSRLRMMLGVRRRVPARRIGTERGTLSIQREGGDADE